ncbi:hypothetical protein B0H14DRAFT_2592241 [Mycena olivaceomarginata]|nr:hypothetical protein B0H14DRAFT_2592241 [Mycena olivaceomarginata]
MCTRGLVWPRVGASRRVELAAPVPTEGEAFLRGARAMCGGKPNEFADGMPRWKKVLEMLEVVPPLQEEKVPGHGTGAKFVWPKQSRNRHYSGTLEHPHHTDKQGATINVFQHFTYLNSNKTLVLDIQGSESHNPSNKPEILFDLMSHTQSGDSGAGDHGEDGIQSFVVQHKCGQRCIQMGLENLGETEEED